MRDRNYSPALFWAGIGLQILQYPRSVLAELVEETVDESKRPIYGLGHRQPLMLKRSGLTSLRDGPVRIQKRDHLLFHNRCCFDDILFRLIFLPRQFQH